MTTNSSYCVVSSIAKVVQIWQNMRCQDNLIKYGHGDLTSFLFLRGITWEIPVNIWTKR